MLHPSIYDPTPLYMAHTSKHAPPLCICSIPLYMFSPSIHTPPSYMPYPTTVFMKRHQTMISRFVLCFSKNIINIGFNGNIRYFHQNVSCSKYVFVNTALICSTPYKQWSNYLPHVFILNPVVNCVACFHCFMPLRFTCPDWSTFYIPVRYDFKHLYL